MLPQSNWLLALKCLDLTSLNSDDNEQGVRDLIADAQTPYGDVAAVCVYPKFVQFVGEILGPKAKNINIATVVNFPTGKGDIESVVTQTQDALAQGATEIDVVLPYQSFMDGEAMLCRELLEATRSVCDLSISLKVIIESGELKTESLIRSASELAIESGANFVKTSTGKTATSATIEAVDFILTTIEESRVDCGVKVSGGVRTSTDAEAYLNLIESKMGRSWIQPNRFRFGASSLLTNLISALSGQKEQSSKGY